MPGHVDTIFPRKGLSASLLALLALGAAGCSSDVARFNENPFASRSAASTEVTGSVPRVQSAPVGRIEAQPLPKGQAQPLPPPRTNAAQTRAGGFAGGAPGIGAYRPQQAPGGVPAAGDVTGSVPRQPVTAPQRPAPQGGGAVIMVGPGETLFSLARRHGVSVATIAQANALTPPYALQLGQRLVIPGGGPAGQPATAPAAMQTARAQAPATVPAAPSYGGFHIAGPGDTLMRIAQRYRVPVGELARANNLAPHAQIKMGDRLVIPARTSSAPLSAPEQTAATKPAPARPEPSQQVAAAPAEHQANLASPASVPEQAGAGDGGSATFRWPVRGRIVAGFGPLPNGQRNDGINIAVPEGTPIRAAEDGEVAYAGNELKGYGNLILLRHANGYVTAYAHASELLVKRGDKVKRGQIIGRAGQTGNISSPQLHFEIRRGSTPVDPMPYLGA